jgi:hypothetical protein
MGLRWRVHESNMTCRYVRTGRGSFLSSDYLLPGRAASGNMVQVSNECG